MTGSLTESTLRWRGGAREPVREEAAAGKGEHMDQSEPTLPAAPKPLPPKQTPRALVLATALGLALGVLVSAVYYDRVLRAGPVVDDDDEFAEFARYTDPNDPHYGESDLLLRTANQSQPLLQYVDNALPDDEFKALQECMRDHPMRHSNVNSDYTFGKTKGFIVSFNARGINRVAQHKHFKCMMPFFNRHRLPVSNAWILNMVWAEMSDYNKEFAIERHTDDALDLDYPGNRKVLPYQTSVLYVFLPEDMVGGEIEAYPYAMPESLMDSGEAKPFASVTPALNRMAFFRGDAWHQVRSYTSKKSDKVMRASLVLENYHIPVNLESYVVDFSWRDGPGNAMM